MRAATWFRGAALAWLLPAAAFAAPADGPPPGAADSVPVDRGTRVDHDRRPIPQPPEWEPNYWKQQFRYGIVHPITHLFDVSDKILWVADVLGADPDRQSVNVNAFDEVPNSSWFTNRNHRRAVPIADLRDGPHANVRPVKPWTIKSGKQSGASAGFRVKDAAGKNWLVKLDPAGHPQLASGADMIARTLVHAAGYNVPNNRAVRFRREDLKIDEELLSGDGEETFLEADLDSVLTRAAHLADGSYSGYASLFLEGKVLGSPSMERLRPGDSNDWYTHLHRRELRGLYVLFSWIGNWDAKDQQLLDLFVETRDSLGHVEHYLLDVGASLGAGGRGRQQPWAGFEHTVDFSWAARRLFTFGFIEEPWQRLREDPGIPSVGRFESEEFEPDDFKPILPHPAFRHLTDRDGYWAAKIVSSFSDAQIAAAVDAAQYEDRRARDFLVKHLTARRDKIAQYWFDRVAPLDFFAVRDGVLYFHDLAVDIGLERTRAYEVDVEGSRARVLPLAADGGARRLEAQTAAAGAVPRHSRVRLTEPALPLAAYGDASRLEIELSIAGEKAKPARVELTRKDSAWQVTRVVHDP